VIAHEPATPALPLACDPLCSSVFALQRAVTLP
jgi:hypothetical protein